MVKPVNFSSNSYYTILTVVFWFLYAILSGYLQIYPIQLLNSYEPSVVLPLRSNGVVQHLPSNISSLTKHAISRTSILFFFPQIVCAFISMDDCWSQVPCCRIAWSSCSRRWISYTRRSVWIMRIGTVLCMRMRRGRRKSKKVVEALHKIVRPFRVRVVFSESYLCVADLLVSSSRKGEQYLCGVDWM